MAASDDHRNPDGGTVLPLQEEAARVEKRDVVTGRVKVHTQVEQIEQLVEAELAGEEIEVTRVPIGREVDEAPQMRTEGDVTIVPLLEEVLKVEKQLVLKEELHIRRKASNEAVRIPVVLKKQRAVVEREEVSNEAQTEEN